MKNFYYGNLEVSDANEALRELELIQQELKNFPPTEVVWDSENLSLKPPWGDDIAPTITDLSNYFVTNDGKDLIERIKESLRETIKMKSKLTIR